MKHSTPFRMLMALGMLTLLFTSSCEKESLEDSVSAIDALEESAKAHTGSKIITHYGPAQPIGGGIMRSVLQITQDGEAVAIGMMISERSLHNLPHMMQQYVLEFHKKASVTPFTHILFDWNPEGHSPAMFYGLPHFDMHLYTVSIEDRMAVRMDDPQTQEEVGAVWAYMPQGYVPTGEVVPEMGMHWIDPTSPEFNGDVFTHTFITGSYNDQFTFFEPMFTLDFLMDVNAKIKTAIKPYGAVQKPGYYYPTSYSFQYDPIRKVYIMLLEDMVMR